MTTSFPLATAWVRAWLKLPQVKQAFIVGQTDFSPAFIEVLRAKLARKLIDFYDGYRHPSKSGHPLRYQIQFVFELMLLFFHHPFVVFRWFGYRFLPPSMAHVPAQILVFSNGLHLASYASLIKSLHRSRSVHLVTDHQDPLDAFYLSQYGLFPRTFKKFAPDQHVITTLRRQLSHLEVTLPSHLKLSSWITARQFNPLVKACLQELTTTFLPTFLAKYAAAQALMTATRPQLLITTHEPGPSATAYVLAAKDHGVATLLLLHGVPSQGMFFFSDYLQVWGPLTKKFIARQGIPKTKLIPGGQPIFPVYEQYFRKHRRQPKSVTIGIILSGYGANEPHQISYVKDLVRQLGKLKPPPKIILRLHPGQYLDHITPAHLDPGHTIEEFIANCSLVISQTSTAVLIAALSNRPLIYFPALHPLIPQGILWQYRAFGAVSSVNQAVKKVQQLLHQPEYRRQHLKKQRQQVLEYTGPIDAKLGDRLAKKIIKLLVAKP